MESLLQDIRYSLRRMAWAPGTALLAILALGLAAGANAVIFSVVQGVLLRPLPFPDAASLFLVFETQGTAGSELQISVPTLEDWRRRSRAFAGLTGAAPALVTLRGQGEAEPVKAALVGADFFPTLGVTMRLGRGFGTAEDDLRRPVPAIVLSEELWRRRFAADPAILGRSFRLGDTAVTVLGVLLLIATGLLVRSFARRALAGVDSSQAPYRVDTLEHLVAKATSQARFNMLLFSSFGAVALVLGASGIFGLLSLFVVRRRREIGIRMALGARRVDVLRQILGHGMILAGAGIAAALVAGFWLTRWMAHWMVGMLFEISATDAPSFLGAAALMAAVAFLSCALPAWRASRVEPVVALRGEA